MSGSSNRSTVAVRRSIAANDGVAEVWPPLLFRSAGMLVPAICFALLFSLAAAPTWAAPGDTSYQATDRYILIDPAGTDPIDVSIDVIVQVEAIESVPATVWSLIATVTPQDGATGTVEFAPPPIVNDDPNLNPASQNPFLDFDRDFGGKSYGITGDTSSELIAFGPYFEPVGGPPPPTDSNDNLTLPSGSGLVALPLTISPDSLGAFGIDFDPDPDFTGVSYATGLPEPDDIALHPTGPHVPGTLTVVRGILGDMDFDGDADFDDIDVFVRGLTDPDGYEAAFGVPSFVKGDIDQDGDHDFDDISGFVQILTNRADAGAVTASVPEPSSLALVLAASGLWLAVARRT
ncbi:MAG: PEP-CTERM sorting domain-containing protein [Pirellulales bacterium]